MSTILDIIMKQKAIEIEEFKKLKELPARKNPILSFKEQLKTKHMNIIAEIKRASPSKGAINEHIDPVKQAKQYESLGANAISVLTDEQFFKGSMIDLKNVAEAVTIPVLCKDFVKDPIQIDVAKAYGASIILLIVAALSDEILLTLYKHAKDADLEVLVEVHNKEEMERALKLNASIIGINNRDLKTFDVDLEITGNLAKMIENKNTTLVSESGIQTSLDVEQVERLGAEVILVGETFMRSDNLSQTFTDFQVPFTKGNHTDAH